MPKIRNLSGEARETPYGIADVDGILEVPERAVYGFTCSSVWDAVDKAAVTAHTEGAKAEAARVAAEAGVVEPEPEAAPPDA